MRPSEAWHGERAARGSSAARGQGRGLVVDMCACACVAAQGHDGARERAGASADGAGRLEIAWNEQMCVAAGGMGGHEACVQVAGPYRYLRLMW